VNSLLVLAAYAVMSKLFDVLNLSKVVRVAGVYTVTAWLLIQVANNIFPAFDLPR
jgi:hypothetical protein